MEQQTTDMTALHSKMINSYIAQVSNLTLELASTNAYLEIAQERIQELEAENAELTRRVEALEQGAPAEVADVQTMVVPDDGGEPFAIDPE